MCLFSAPSPPPAPDPNAAVAAREAAAKKAEKDEKTRLGKKKGGRAFLTEGKGFGGISETLLGAKVDKL